MTKQEECNLKAHLPDDIVERIEQYEKDYDYIDFENCVYSLLRDTLDQRSY